MDWVYLIIAGLFEIFGVMMMNRIHIHRDIQSLLFLIVGFAGSFILLSLAMETIPMGTAYAVWTGIGASGGTIIGMILYGESKDWKRIAFIALILGSTIGLKLIS